MNHCLEMENKIEQEYEDAKLSDKEQLKLDMFMKGRIEKQKQLIM